MLRLLWCTRKYPCANKYDCLQRGFDFSGFDTDVAMPLKKLRMSRISDFSRIALGIRDRTEGGTVYSIIAKTLTLDMGAENFANRREIRENLSLEEPKAPALAKISLGERG
jgi:hypothetical protein